MSLFSFCTSVFAKPEAPTQYNTFDGLPPGGRSLGLGYAYSTVGGDPSIIYFNPAGLGLSEDSLLSFSYEITRQSALTSDEIVQGEALQIRNLVFIGLSNPQGALSWRPLASDAIHIVSGLDKIDTQTKINAYTFSVKTKEDKVYTGLNLTYLSGRIGQSKIINNIPSAVISDGNGVSLDLGTICKVSDELNVGLNLKNLCGFMWWDDYETDLLPFSIVTGFSFNISKFSIFAFDWEKRYYRKDDSSPQELTHIGLEQSLGNILSFQIGMYGPDLNNKNLSRFTGGISYQKGSYKLSLAGEKYMVSSNDVYRYLFSLNIPVK
ncbi:MAG: hypothetical protein LHV68_02570 [Elusimicrobia bacterium]|nr:hypothetical protein [Candidatus Liberimonas magnetica]